MPTTLTEFTDDTAFERYVLDRAAPLLPRPRGTSVIELGDAGSVGVIVGPATVRVGMADSAGSAEEQLTADDVRPLLFGAAWKVLDQLFEFALEHVGVAHDARWRYTIAFKVREAMNGRVPPIPPFDRRPDLWPALTATYGSTEQLRNSLVHRRLVVDPFTGDISGAAGQHTLAPVTADEQSAFCQIAVGAAEAVISGTLSGRRADQLGWTLDRLSSHHGGQPFNTSPVRGVIPKVVARASPGSSNELSIDFGDVAIRARAAVQGVSHYDVEIHLPDGRILAGALEDAPPGRATFPVASPPSWLRWV